MRRAPLIAVLLVLASASNALGQTKNAPPGNAGVDQYLETVPAADGNQPSSAAGSRGTRQLPKATRHRLQAAGEQGKVLTRLVQASAPALAARTASTGSARTADTPRSAGSSAAALPAKDLPKSVAAPSIAGSGPGGMGLLLPLLLAAAVVWASIVVLRRRGR